MMIGNFFGRLFSSEVKAEDMAARVVRQLQESEYCEPRKPWYKNPGWISAIVAITIQIVGLIAFFVRMDDRIHEQGKMLAKHDVSITQQTEKLTAVQTDMAWVKTFLMQNLKQTKKKGE